MKMDLHGSSSLTQFVCSPFTCCRSLLTVDLSCCKSLQFVLVQSSCMHELNLSRCGSLRKVLIQCQNLRSLSLEGCSAVHTIMVWSDSLVELDLSSCMGLKSLALHCSKLDEHKLRMPVTNPFGKKADHRHAPLAQLIVENLNEHKRLDQTVISDKRDKPSGNAGQAMPFVHDRP